MSVCLYYISVYVSVYLSVSVEVILLELQLKLFHIVFLPFDFEGLILSVSSLFNFDLVWN